MKNSPAGAKPGIKNKPAGIKNTSPNCKKKKYKNQPGPSLERFRDGDPGEEQGDFYKNPFFPPKSQPVHKYLSYPGAEKGMLKVWDFWDLRGKKGFIKSILRALNPWNVPGPALPHLVDFFAAWRFFF